MDLLVLQTCHLRTEDRRRHLREHVLAHQPLSTSSKGRGQSEGTPHVCSVVWDAGAQDRQVEGWLFDFNLFDWWIGRLNGWIGRDEIFMQFHMRCCTSKMMDGCSEWTNERTNGWMDEWMNEWMNVWLVEDWIDGWTDGWIFKMVWIIENLSFFLFGSVCWD